MLWSASQQIRNNSITHTRYTTCHEASPQLLSHEDIVCVYEYIYIYIYIYDIAACSGSIEINIFPFQEWDGYVCMNVYEVDRL